MEQLDGEVSKTKILLTQSIFDKVVKDLDMGVSGKKRYIGTGKCYNNNDDLVAQNISEGLDTNIGQRDKLIISVPAKTKFIREVMEAPIIGKIGNDDETSSQKGIICLNNMVLDTKLRIETQMRPKLTTFLPVDYDVTVESKEITKFMKAIFGKYEPEMKKFLGSCLIRDKSVAFKKFFVVVKGKAGAGKSLFSNFINDLFGDTATQLSLPDISGRFDRVRLVDKFVNVANEISFDDVGSKEIIKGLTGRDRMKVEAKYENSQNKEIYASFIFLGNEDLSLSASDGAVEKRGYNYDIEEIHGGKSLKEVYGKELDELIPGTNPKIMKNGKSYALTYVLEGMEDYIEAAKDDENGIGLTKNYDMKSYIKDIGVKQSNLHEGGDDREQGVVRCDECPYFNGEINEKTISGGNLKANYEHGLDHQRAKKNHYNNNIVHFMEANGGQKEDLGARKIQGNDIKC